MVNTKILIVSGAPIRMLFQNSVTYVEATSMVQSFIVQSMVPFLQPFDGKSHRSVVVMDNASIHHVDQVAFLIQSTGAVLYYLPP